MARQKICLTNFIFERSGFQEGIIYISLYSCESIEAVVSFLDSSLGYLSKNINTNKESKGNLITQVCDHLKDKCGEVLLVFDDADQVLNNDRGSFRDLVEIILLTCPKIKILITSRTSVGGGLQGFTEKVYDLAHLDKMNAKELFLLRAPRPIQDSEIIELMEYRPTTSELEYMQSLQSSHDDNTHSQTKNNQGGFWNKPSNKKITEQPLEDHLIMGILGGHPQSINLAAALLVDRSLKGLFKLLTSKPLLEVLNVPDLSPEERTSFNSLQVSLDVSIEHLAKRSKEAVRFFGFMGLLPAGISEEELDKIWRAGWDELAGILIRSSLLKRSNKKVLDGKAWYTLYPFMARYAEQKLEHKDLVFFSQEIAKHLVEKGTMFFNKLAISSAESKVNFDVFLLEEPNFKACIHRELHNNDKKSPRQSLQNSLMSSSCLLTSSKGTEIEVLSLSRGSLKLLESFNNTKQSQVKKQLKSNEPAEEPNSDQEEQEDAAPIVVTENMANMLRSSVYRNSSQSTNQNVLSKSDDDVEKKRKSTQSGPFDPPEVRSSLMAIKNLRESTENQNAFLGGTKWPDNEYIDNQTSEVIGIPRMSNASVGSVQRFSNSNTNKSSPDKEQTESGPTSGGIGRLSLMPRRRQEFKTQEEKEAEEGPIEVAHFDAANIINPQGFSQSSPQKSPEKTRSEENDDPFQSVDAQASAKYQNFINENAPTTTEPIGRMSLARPSRLPQQRTGTIDSEYTYLQKTSENSVSSHRESFKGPDRDNNTKGFSGDERVRTDSDERRGNDEDQNDNSWQGDASKKKQNDFDSRGSDASNKQSAVKSQRGSHPSKDEDNEQGKLSLKGSAKFIGRTSGSIKSMTKSTKGKPPLKSTPASKDSQVVTRDGSKISSIDKKRMKASCHVTLLYCSILFLLRRYGECEKIIEHGETLYTNLKDKLASANFKKLKACLNWIKKDFEGSVKEFTSALDEFRNLGCLLGTAVCEAALGYLKANILEDKDDAIKRLEEALNIYRNLDHVFGQYYVHQWLAILMNKVPRLKAQSKMHSEEAKKIIQAQNKQGCLESKHKGGLFVVRWKGDNFGVFLEIPEYYDNSPIRIQPKKTNVLASELFSKEEPKAAAKNLGRSSTSILHKGSSVHYKKPKTASTNASEVKSSTVDISTDSNVMNNSSRGSQGKASQKGNTSTELTQSQLEKSTAEKISGEKSLIEKSIANERKEAIYEPSVEKSTTANERKEAIYEPSANAHNLLTNQSGLFSHSHSKLGHSKVDPSATSSKDKLTSSKLLLTKPQTTLTQSSGTKDLGSQLKTKKPEGITKHSPKHDAQPERPFSGRTSMLIRKEDNKIKQPSPDLLQKTTKTTTREPGQSQQSMFKMLSPVADFNDIAKLANESTGQKESEDNSSFSGFQIPSFLTSSMVLNKPVGLNSKGRESSKQQTTNLTSQKSPVGQQQTEKKGLFSSMFFGKK